MMVTPTIQTALMEIAPSRLLSNLLQLYAAVGRRARCEGIGGHFAAGHLAVGRDRRNNRLDPLSITNTPVPLIRSFFKSWSARFASARG